MSRLIPPDQRKALGRAYWGFEGVGESRFYFMRLLEIKKLELEIRRGIRIFSCFIIQMIGRAYSTRLWFDQIAQ